MREGGDFLIWESKYFSREGLEDFYGILIALSRAPSFIRISGHFLSLL
jgi:hypothetical protein